jgi:hypothetical protein
MESVIQFGERFLRKAGKEEKDDENFLFLLSCFPQRYFFLFLMYFRGGALVRVGAAWLSE